MSEPLRAEEFPAFYTEIHQKERDTDEGASEDARRGQGGESADGEGVDRREPFLWQARLVEDWLTQGRCPEVIDVPTGFGKTSVIAAWVFALAAERSAREVPRLPRRLAFVVDRRLVVDSAFDHARRLVTRLGAAADDRGVVGRVRRALLACSGEQGTPLEAVRMRGGVTWESRWLARPDQPAIVTGTIDQFGSRLLFRGYGVSDEMRPINAALVGTDTWLVIDEAHIARPLAQTVASVASYQQGPGQRRFPLADRALRVTRMSATTGTADNKGPAADSDGERRASSAFIADPEAQRTTERFPRSAREAAKRLDADKPAALVDLSYLASGSRAKWRAKAEQLGTALATLADRQAADEGVYGVIANTVPTARAAMRALEAAGHEAILLVGRCRAYERDALLEEWGPRIEVGGERMPGQRLFVVATQTIEVGADLDFDGIVTECAPLSALVQRFGRVNRVGARQSRRSAVVHAGFTHSDDPVYGEATRTTWDYLAETARTVTLVTSAKRVASALDDEPEEGDLDFGIEAARRLRADAPDKVSEEEPLTPVLLGAHLEHLAATWPAPRPDLDVAPYLHGAEHGVPEVPIAWRAPLPHYDGGEKEVEESLAKKWQAWLDLLPPVDWETVSVPIWEAQAFLRRRAAATPTSDLEAAASPEDEESEQEAAFEGLLGVVYRGRKESPTIVWRPTQVRPNDLLVLPTDRGGHDQWGWTGFVENLDPVRDVAEFAPRKRRAGVRRLAWDVVKDWLAADASEEEVEALRAAFASMEPGDEEADITPDDVLSTLISSAVVDEALRQRYGADGTGRASSADKWRPTPFRGSVGQDRKKGRVVLLFDKDGALAAAVSAQDGDETGTSMVGERTPLDVHGAEVGETAREFAANLGLHGFEEAVRLAGWLHDLGKADRRFQAALHDGDSRAAAHAPVLLAKSGRDGRDPVARRAREIAGVPGKFRHEALSEQLAADAIADHDSDVDTDLVLHLVASHHGMARPLLPAIEDPGPKPASVEVDGRTVTATPRPTQIDWSHPQRFDELNERYGWWGLALLETVVRLADMLCSAGSEVDR